MTHRDILEEYLQPGLPELKRHLRITADDQDALLLSYLKAAALSAEHHIGRCLEASRFRYVGPFAPSVTLEHVNRRLFPVDEGPAVYVDGVQTEDFTFDGRTVTLGADVEGERLRIDYRCAAPAVEADIRVAILLIASKYYTNPVDSVETLPSVATNLLGQYRRWGLDDDDYGNDEQC